MLGKFILRVLVFLSIPTVILGGWGAFIITLDYRSYVSSLPVPSGKDIVICGDSHSKDCLDPTYFPRLHNYSTAAANPDQNLLRLKDVLAANKGHDRLKYVLIDVTPLQLGHKETTPLSDLGSARVHALLNFYHHREVTRPFGSIVKIFRDVILIRKFQEFRKSMRKGRKYRSSLTGGFDAVKTRGFIEFPEKAAKDLNKKAAAFNRKAHFSNCDQLAGNLRAQADIVKAAGLTPIFMITPVSEPLQAKMNRESVDALTNGVQRIASEYNSPVFNYLTHKFPVEYWRDANHMNEKGAAEFTDLFQKDFNAFERMH